MNSDTLWQQILTSPGDAKRKAAYLQALAEEGDPRTEIFRLATEIKNLIHGYFEKHAALTKQYESILAGWRDEFDVPAKIWHGEVKFVEGWPTELTIAARDFVQHATDIVSTMPLRHLNLTSVSEIPEVFRIPQFGQVASLDGSHQRWSDAAIQALADSPQVASLRWLDLRDTGIIEAQVEIVAASPHLRSVEHLDLAKNPSRDPVDAAAGCGVDGVSGYIVPESIYLPDFGHELEARQGRIHWLHALDHYLEKHPPSRHLF